MTSFFLFFLLQALSIQTTKYTFDYKIKYNYFDYVDSTRNGKIINYINSENNRYYISVYLKNNAQPVIRFLDYQGLIYINQTNLIEIDNNNFNFETLSFKKYKNPYIFRRNEYDFIKKPDTVLKNKLYKNILLATNNHKQEQKKKLAKNRFIIDTTLMFKPLFVFSTAYEMWKIGKVFSDGMIIEKHLINFNNQIENSEIFESLEKISFHFEIKGGL